MLNGMGPQVVLECKCPQAPLPVTSVVTWVKDRHVGLVLEAGTAREGLCMPQMVVVVVAGGGVGTP